MTNEIIHRQLNPILAKHGLKYDEFLNNCVGLSYSKIPQKVRNALLELVDTSVLTSPEAVSKSIGVSISTLKYLKINRNK